VALAGFSAGFKHIFTGLVVSNHAPDCTQNAVFRDRKLKTNLGRRTSSENPQPLGAFGPTAFII